MYLFLGKNKHYTLNFFPLKTRKKTTYATNDNYETQYHVKLIPFKITKKICEEKEVKVVMTQQF